MDKTGIEFLNIFRCAIHGRAPELTSNTDIATIKKLADRHNAWPLVFMVLKDFYKDEDPCEGWADYRNKFFF